MLMRNAKYSVFMFAHGTVSLGPLVTVTIIRSGKYRYIITHMEVD